MEPISVISQATGVNVNTLRAWARDGEIKPAERLITKYGFSWHTTESAVYERLNKPQSSGRHIKIGA